MQTERADILCEFLKDALELFSELLKGKGVKEEYLPLFKDRFSEEEFVNTYNEFLDELKVNILEYKDLPIICDYLDSTLDYFYDWEGFEVEINSQIIKKGFEVNFLLKLKLSIDTYASNVEQMFQRKPDYKIDYLSDFFDRVLEEEDGVEDVEVCDRDKPLKDERFDFDKMLKDSESNNQNILAQITFIQDRLYDFKQWQLQYDVEVAFPNLLQRNESPFRYTNEYYPNFERLCAIQLERLDRKLDLEKKALTHQAIANNPVVIQGGDASPYNWDASATDMLELVAALHKSDSLKRKDGRPLTRKELIDYFQQIFNMDIKDAEGKLNKATSRKKNMTPFLDGLKATFESYAEEKEEKLLGRR